MPSYNRFAEIASQRFLLNPGRKVVVNISTGNDTTGDGSVSAPYLTMARGAQDLRDGRNDVLLLTGNAGATTAEPPVVISNRSNIALIQAGTFFISNPTTRRALSPVSAWTIASGRARATVTSGHGLVASDWVFVHNADTTGTARMRGLAQVHSVTATTVDLLYLAPVAGQQPITGGNQGVITPCPLTVVDCEDVVCTGLRIASPILADVFSGLGFAASTGSQISKNIVVAGCSFLSGALGFAGMPSGFSLLAQGSGFVVEGNVFSLQSFGAAFTPTARSFGMVYLTDGADYTFADNVFQRSDGFNEAYQPDGCIHLANDPRYATVFTSNRFDGSASAGQGIPLDRIVRVQPTRTPARVFFEGNFYSHAAVTAGLENFAIDAAGLVRERVAARFPGQDRIPTQIEVVRRGVGVLGTFRVTGGTASAVQTTATQADGWYDGARVIVYGAAGGAFAIVHSYVQASGVFTLEAALPFTPAAGDTFLVLGTDDVHALLDHPLAPHTIPGTVGEALNNADVATSTRAAPGDAMDLVADAVDASAVAVSGAQEIAAEVEADLSATHGAGSWETATGFATPGDVSAAEATVLAAVAALNDLSVADVQAALTAQGYTTVRAALLDFLDVAVSSRAAPGAAMDLVTDALDADAVAASGAAEIAAAVAPAPSAAAVADAVWDEPLAGHVGVDSAGEAAVLARAAAAGRVRLNTGNPAQWVLELYAEDSTTVLRTLELRDQSGAAISAANNPLVVPTVLFADREEP